jgi:hypothetical protein
MMTPSFMLSSRKHSFTPISLTESWLMCPYWMSPLSPAYSFSVYLTMIDSVTASVTISNLAIKISESSSSVSTPNSSLST